ncbi:MAG: FHA domain-containing protein [Myxococcaceae bacterium]
MTRVPRPSVPAAEPPDEKDPYARTDMRPAPSGKSDRTEMRPSPFAVESQEKEWEAPPGKMSREQPAAKGQPSPSPAPGAGRMAKKAPLEAEPEPGAEEPEYATGSEYIAEGGDSSDPGPEPEAEEPGQPGGTLDLDGESKDDDPYGEKDYPSEDREFEPLEPDGPRIGARSETRISPLEDLEPEAEGESAEDDNATRAGPPIKLKIVAGPDAGKTKKFNGVRMVIGRTQGCELKLSDQSVSRRHLELVQGKDGVLLRDLGSGNGTKVNGEKVAEKLLQHDDEIAIGKTKFRYVDELAAFKKLRDDAEKKEAGKAQSPPPKTGESASEEPKVVVAPESGVGSKDEIEDEPSLHAKTHAGIPAPKLPPRPARSSAARKGQNPWEKLDPKKKKLVVAGGAGALLLLVILIVVATRKPAPPPVDPRKAPAAEQMQLARTAVRAERYEEAVKAVTEAEKILPGIDSEHLLDRATQEMAAQKAAETVRSLIEQGRFEDARGELAGFPTTTAKREDEKKKLETELAEKELGYLTKKATELLEARDLEAARQIIQGLPPEKQASLLLQADTLEAELKAEEKVEAQKGAQRAVANKRARDAAQEAQLQQAFVSVARKFHGGEYQRAAAECDRVVDEHRGDAEVRARAKRLQSLIPNFGRNFEEGHKKYKAGQLANSVKPLRRARELYQQIGFPGALGEQIDEELAAAALAAGRAALAHGDLGGAALNFRDASNLDPTDSRAREGLDQVGARAEDLFTEAYMVRDRDPREAIAKFRLVLEVTQPSSTTYQRAKNQLAALQPDKP